MQEETTRDFITRMSRQLAAIGQGKPAKEARLLTVVAKQRPPTNKYKVPRSGKQQRGKPARPVRCVETGEVWPSIVDCAVANGGTRNGMGMAFRRAKGSSRGAFFHGKHFVLVSEDEGAGCHE